MIALNGVRPHELDRAGTVLANFDTPVSDTRGAPGGANPGGAGGGTLNGAATANLKGSDPL
jgi:hypothetical protein